MYCFRKALKLFARNTRNHRQRGAEIELVFKNDLDTEWKLGEQTKYSQTMNRQNIK